MSRIAFNLDETLGVPVIDGNVMLGFQLRPGCRVLLERLQSNFQLCLWTVSRRRYLDRVLAFGLSRWITETYSWDEMPAVWKDVRQIRAEGRPGPARLGAVGVASAPDHPSPGPNACEVLTSPFESASDHRPRYVDGTL